jgi:hypothetical protein
MNKNHKTLDVDQLFVRNIVFKDFSNRPISSNQFLTTRGDGGIYFSDQSTTSARAFVEVRAGDIQIPATTTSNILYLGAGAGIQYYSTAIGGGINTKLYITATAPEQITVIGDKTLNFSSLRDDPAGGRTLYYAGTGDTTVNVSDTTIVFGSVYNSSYGSLTSTISTTEAILGEQSTLVNVLTSTISSAVDILSSVNLSTLYDLSDTILELSSFVWSTFVRDESGNHSILNIDTINSKNIDASAIETSTIKIGHTSILDSNYQDMNDSFCTAIVSTGTVYTVANYMIFDDEITGVKFGFDKEYLSSISTSYGSTFQTLGKMYQLGLITQLSTQGTASPLNPREQFKPAIQQIEVVEQLVTYQNVGSNVVSTTTNINYDYKTIGKFDEICGADDQLVINGVVSISTLYVSSLNGGGGSIIVGINSTVSTFYVSSLWAKNAYISSARISTAQIRNANVSTGNISSLIFNNAIGNNLSVNTISSGQIGTGSMIAGDIYAYIGAFDSVSTNKLSTCDLSFCQATGTSVIAEYAEISSGRICDLSFCHASGDSISTLMISTGSIVAEDGDICELRFCHGIGSSISTFYTSTGQLYFGDGAFEYAAGANTSTGQLRFGEGTFVSAAGSNLSTFNISTGQLYFGNASGSNLSTFNISTGQLYFNVGTGSNLSTFNTSTGQLRFGDGTFVYAEGSNLSTFNASTGQLRFGDGTFVYAAGSNLSTFNASTGQLRFGDGTFVYAAGSNLSTFNASTGQLRFGDGTFVYAAGSNLSTINASTGQLRFGEGSASNLDILTISSGSITFNVAEGNAVSTSYMSASQILNSSFFGTYANISTIHNSSIYTYYMQTNMAEASTANISSLYSDYVSTGKARIGELDVNCISANCISTGLISWGDAYGSTMTVLDATISTVRLSTVMGFTEPIFTFDMANRRVGVNLGLTQQPRATMDIRGIVYANNFVTTSDRRLKHSIQPLHISDSRIPSAYQYVNEDGSDDIGVMADEIECIAPECVYTRPDGYKAVSYTKLVPVCLTLIRSLSERIAKLEQGSM